MDNGPVEFEKWTVQVQGFEKIVEHCRRIYKI